MNRFQRTHKVHDRNRGTEGYGRSSTRQGSAGKVVLMFPKASASAPVTRDLADHLALVSLVIAVVLPALLVSVAVHDFQSFGVMMLGYVLAGSIGAWLIQKVNNVTETTPIAPRASERQKPNLRRAA